MKNIQGKEENLELFHTNGEVAYWYRILSDGYSCEYTFDENGDERTYKNSDGEMRGFDTEYTMEEIKEMLGKEFKIKL